MPVWLDHQTAGPYPEHLLKKEFEAQASKPMAPAILGVAKGRQPCLLVGIEVLAEGMGEGAWAAVVPAKGLVLPDQLHHQGRIFRTQRH